MNQNFPWDLPWGQWLRFHASTAGGQGLIPGQRTKILHAPQHGQKVKTKRQAKEFSN